MPTKCIIRSKIPPSKVVAYFLQSRLFIIEQYILLRLQRAHTMCRFIGTLSATRATTTHELTHLDESTSTEWILSTEDYGVAPRIWMVRV